jgi:signal transduction histidine kinase
MISGSSNGKIRWPALAIILLVTLIVIFSGILFYRSQKRKFVNEKQSELSAISSLKINEIENWRNEHIRDGEILQSIIPRNQIILNFLKDENLRDQGRELLERIKIFIRNYDYHSVLLIDTTGSVRLIYPSSDSIPSLSSSQLHDLENPAISLSDLHYSDDIPGKVHLDLQIPLFISIKNKMTRFGTMLLRIDPGRDLYPLIQSWPTPSKSSETLLIKRDGDSVLFLNELRHKTNTALRLKLPMSDDLPASKAVTGYEGIFEGIDYRGIPVISFLKRIPDSPWFMVTKVDKREIYSPLNEIIFFITIIAFLFILLFSLLIFYLWKNQHIRYLRELNITKDRFFSIVSHDLRSPFTSIKGFADILVDEIAGKDPTNIDLNNVKKYAEIIKNSSQNAVDLLRNLTEWSRLNTDRLKFNPREFDLAAVINYNIDLMKVTAMQKTITFSKTVPSRLEIFADKEMISLVLRNLISNSIKFSNPGGNIHISAGNNGQETRVEVCDTGVGMEKEVIDKLFRTEEIVTTPGTHREKGTGLGLILVKEFITLHGGHVFVNSEAGKCTRFSFTLPIRIQQKS